MFSDSDLKTNLSKLHQGKLSNNENITYIKRSKMIPFTGEMRRIMLAFESHLQDEIRFSLNHLLMYSCSDISPIILENYEMIFVGMMNYLEFISKNIPYLFRNEAPNLHKFRENDRKNVLKNYNFEIFELMKDYSKGQEKAKKEGGSGSGGPQKPIDILREDRKMEITMKYEEVSRKEILEQVSHF